MKTLALSAFFLFAMTATAADNLQPGNSFPTVVLPTIDGKSSISVTEFRGQKLLLQLYAAW